VYVVNNDFVSFRGDGADKKGGGLSFLNPAHFGFYITKFRLKGGFSTNHSTAWHPCLWASPFNLGRVDKRLNPMPKDWVEIDFMEYIEQWPSFWHSQLIPRANNKVVTFSGRALMHKRDTGYDNWVTLGLEYNKEGFMQLWENIDNIWREIGTKV